jgi:exocyst complex component 4
MSTELTQSSSLCALHSVPDLEVTDRDLFPSPLSQSPSQTDNNPSPASPSSRKSTKLTLYLQDLLMRPSLDPLLDIPEDLSTLPPLPLPTHNRGGSASQQPSAVEPGNGNTSISSFSSSGPNPLGALANPTSASKMANPEADSFIYIEHLLEALAALGKLGWGLDLIAQRETSELFALIEQTVNEVEERSADRRRESMMLLLPATTLLPPPPSASSLDAPPRSTSVNAGSSGSTAFSMHSLNSNNMDENAETLRDLFWTMYSKLDAVLQGLRVVWEVSGRIGGVSLLSF